MPYRIAGIDVQVLMLPVVVQARVDASKSAANPFVSSIG
jgi:hypothetical protein